MRNSDSPERETRPVSPAPQTPRWFYNFFRGYTFYTLVLLGLLYVDFFGNLGAPDPSYGSVIYRLVLGLIVVPGGIAIALLILRRTERNVTGLFLLMYATVVMRSTLRIGSPLYVLDNLYNNAWIGLWLLPLYFPDGTTYPLRFQRLIRVCTIIMSTLFAGVVLFTPTQEWASAIGGEITEVPSILYIPALAPAARVVGEIQGYTWFLTVLLIIPSIVLRYRASRGVVRQQIKLFVWAFAVLVAFFIPLVILFPTGNIGQDSLLGRAFNFAFSAIFFPVMPFVVIGYAILRHRLYDIDVIIRRTLTYALVTGVLVMTYFGGVVLMQSLFEKVTGEQSPLAIVASTLLIAALFTPLRRRVQAVVDRRFHRQGYDMQQALDHFNEQMRDEVEIENIQTAIVDLVKETMEPEHMSLWVIEHPPYRKT